MKYSDMIEYQVVRRNSQSFDRSSSAPSVLPRRLSVSKSWSKVAQTHIYANKTNTQTKQTQLKDKHNTYTNTCAKQTHKHNTYIQTKHLQKQNTYTKTAISMQHLHRHSNGNTTPTQTQQRNSTVHEP